MSTSYSCDCYLHRDHTPLLPGSRGIYHRRSFSMTTLDTATTTWWLDHIYIYINICICHSYIFLYISGLSNVLAYPHLNSLLGHLGIPDTSISYPYKCYLHTYHTPPLLGHWGRIIDALYENVGDLRLLHSGLTQYISIYFTSVSPTPAGCLMFFPTRTLTAALTTKCPVFGLSSELK